MAENSLGTTSEEMDYAESLLATIQALMPQEVDNIYGYTKTPKTTEAVDEFEGMPLGIPEMETGEMELTPITGAMVSELLSGYDEQTRKEMAHDMFRFVPNAYGDADDLFNDDGSIKEGEFLDAFARTMMYAERQAEIGERSDFIDIIMRTSEVSLEESKNFFDERIEELRRKPERIINYIDPAALMQGISTATQSVLGRKATKSEMQAFVNEIHGLQASGTQSISVGARAIDAARAAAPTEAGAMDYSNAASLVMQAAGIGGM
tara:strand:+ start:1123 stop:1914 length:792 start_codon:yes stop_codon:yes gene_type:complete